MKFIQKLDIFKYSVCKYNGADYKKANAIWEHCATLIDNILTNIIISSDSKHLSGITIEKISDHLPVSFLTGEMEITKDPIFYKKNFREINEANLSNFKNMIQSINWTPTNELVVT